LKSESSDLNGLVLITSLRRSHDARAYVMRGWKIKLPAQMHVDGFFMPKK